ncbi:MAG: hypothetical protein GKS07_10940 [Nitrosopumilus sp.]|nr:MAG: hypothetical protein GKS07_00505 [Nitrosopumilus sp.]QMU55357.1 MAG: hypothetical protein GKS07_10940 [Nitrosopumilus sp.]
MEIDEIINNAIGKVENVFKKNIMRVEVVTKPYEYGKPVLKRAVTTSSSRPDTPSIIIENPLDRDIRIFSISMIADDSFKTNGRAEILINDVSYLDEESAATFTNVNEINIPIPPEGELLRAGHSIEFKIRNNDNTTSVALTALVYLGARSS